MMMAPYEAVILGPDPRAQSPSNRGMKGGIVYIHPEMLAEFGFATPES
jgi:hypothetical protein